MQNSTLFLIQSAHQHVDKIWNDLEQMAAITDYIVIMGDAVFQIPNHILHKFPHLYCLEPEQALLNISAQAQITVLGYAAFSDLVLQFKRCISLK